jgi:hypothetical protein
MKLKLASASLLVILLASSWPSTAESEDKDAVPAVLVSNVLTIDSAGSVRFEDKASAVTDVRVLGVESATTGFNLVNPDGFVVFGNQSSTFAGVVEFWYQFLVPGTYTVTGPDGQPVASFDATPYLAPEAGAAAQNCQLDLRLGDLVTPQQAGFKPCFGDPCANGCDITLPPVEDPCANDACNINLPPLPRGCDDGEVGVVVGQKEYCANGQVCPDGGLDCLTDSLLPCGGYGEPPCNANGVCQLAPSNCNVPLPTLGPCSDGMTGYTVNGATTACVSANLGPCPDGKTGYTVNGATTACVAAPTVGPCPDGNLGRTINGATTACIDAGNVRCAESPTPADCVVDYTCRVLDEDFCEIMTGKAVFCATHPVQCVPAPAPPPSSSNPPPAPNPECPANEGSNVAWRETTKLSERTLWTPTLIIHAPSAGTAEVTGGWTKSKGLFIGGNGESSSIESADNFGTANGETLGYFVVAKWGYFRDTYTNKCGGPIADYYYAKIIDHEPNGFKEAKTFEMWYSSKNTDRDDLESVFGCHQITEKCYSSLVFDNRYETREIGWDTKDGGVNPKVGQRTYQSGGGTVSFSYSGKSVSVSLDVSYVADKTTEVYYEYKIPKGGVWSGDYLGKKQGSALAFCDDIRNRNC